MSNRNYEDGPPIGKIRNLVTMFSRQEISSNQMSKKDNSLFYKPNVSQVIDETSSRSNSNPFRNTVSIRLWDKTTTSGSSSPFNIVLRDPYIPPHPRVENRPKSANSNSSGHRSIVLEVSEGSDYEEDEMAPVSQVQIQKPAPFFQGTAVVNGEFKEISLEDYKGKYVVLFFYPLDFTFVCPTEIIAFSERADDFRKIGCELIAASTDSHFSHFAWVNTPRKTGGLGPMNIPLLADKNGEIARKYGVYKEDEGIAFRGLFIIDAKQNLRQITVNDLPVGRSVEETLRLVQAFQFTDKHGEVCPAGWKPGAKTIKPSVNESKAYFENSGH